MARRLLGDLSDEYEGVVAAVALHTTRRAQLAQPKPASLIVQERAASEILTSTGEPLDVLVVHLHEQEEEEEVQLDRDQKEQRKQERLQHAVDL